MFEAAPGSEFGVLRRGSMGDGDEVVATMTVQATDASTAERLAASLLEQALPSVSFTELVAEPLTPTNRFS